MRGFVDGEAKIVSVGIGEIDDFDWTKVGDVGAAIADGHAGFVEAMTQKIVDVALGLILEVGDGGRA